MGHRGELMGKSALVTGASGFIGSHLCRRLCELGIEVHAISRQERSENSGNIVWWQGDLGNFSSVEKLFNTIKPDFVYHLASEVTGSRALEVVMPTFQANLVSTVNILIMAAEMDCQRLVMTGSMEEPSADGVAIPCSPYAAAKWAGSGYARMFHALYQTPVVMARLFMVYGPDQKDMRKLVPYVISTLLREETPRLSSGERPVDWIYVDDVVEGLIAMSLRSGIEGQEIDLGTGKLTTVKQVVELICELHEADIVPEFGSIPERALERVRVADVADTCRNLGWQPRVSLKEGLVETIKWYQKSLAGR